MDSWYYADKRRRFESRLNLTPLPALYPYARRNRYSFAEQIREQDVQQDKTGSRQRPKAARDETQPTDSYRQPEIERGNTVAQYRKSTTIARQPQ